MDLSCQDASATMGVVVDESIKSCTMCGTEKTPLWRSGPAGPKSLCNACGIKHRKRKALIHKNPDRKKQSQSTVNQATSSPSLPITSKETMLNSNSKLKKSASSNLRQSVNMGMTSFGKDMSFLQKQRSIRRQRTEEEEAAVLLMSLSCGAVFA